MVRPRMPKNQPHQGQHKKANDQKDSPIRWYSPGRGQERRAFPEHFGRNAELQEYDFQFAVVPTHKLEQARGQQDRELEAKDGRIRVDPNRRIFHWRIKAGTPGPLLPKGQQSRQKEPHNVAYLSLNQLVGLRKAYENEYPAYEKNEKEREKPYVRKDMCKDPSYREAAWVMLGKLYPKLLERWYGSIPKELLGHFRVDLLGNVVSIEATSNSITAFSLDHIFPYSKGGLTQAANLMPLFELANEKKGNTLINFIVQQREGGHVVNNFMISYDKEHKRHCLDPFPRGLRVPDLAQLWRGIGDAALLQGEGGQNFEQKLHYLQLVLCFPWPSVMNARGEGARKSLPELLAAGPQGVASKFVEVSGKLAQALPAIQHSVLQQPRSARATPTKKGEPAAARETAGGASPTQSDGSSKSPGVATDDDDGDAVALSDGGEGEAEDGVGDGGELTQDGDVTQEGDELSEGGQLESGSEEEGHGRSASHQGEHSSASERGRRARESARKARDKATQCEQELPGGAAYGVSAARSAKPALSDDASKGVSHPQQPPTPAPTTRAQLPHFSASVFSDASGPPAPPHAVGHSSAHRPTHTATASPHHPAHALAPAQAAQRPPLTPLHARATRPRMYPSTSLSLEQQQRVQLAMEAGSASPMHLPGSLAPSERPHPLARPRLHPPTHTSLPPPGTHSHPTEWPAADSAQDMLPHSAAPLHSAISPRVPRVPPLRPTQTPILPLIEPHDPPLASPSHHSALAPRPPLSAPAPPQLSPAHDPPLATPSHSALAPKPRPPLTAAAPAPPPLPPAHVPPLPLPVSLQPHLPSSAANTAVSSVPALPTGTPDPPALLAPSAAMPAADAAAARPAWAEGHLAARPVAAPTTKSTTAGAAHVPPPPPPRARPPAPPKKGSGFGAVLRKLFCMGPSRSDIVPE